MSLCQYTSMRTPEDFYDFINEKIVLTEHLVMKQKAFIDEMKSHLALAPLTDKEDKNMEYEVSITELSPQLAACIRFKRKVL